MCVRGRRSIFDFDKARNYTGNFRCRAGDIGGLYISSELIVGRVFFVSNYAVEATSSLICFQYPDD